MNLGHVLNLCASKGISSAVPKPHAGPGLGHLGVQRPVGAPGRHSAMRFRGLGVLSRFVFGVLGSVSLNSVLKIRVSHLCKTASFIQSDVGIQKN